MAMKLIWEIFKAVDEAKSQKEREKILRQNDTPALRHVLKGCFDRSVIWLLPKTTPPYRPDDSPDGLTTTTLHKESVTFYLFCQAGVSSGKVARDWKQREREHKFIQLLERIPHQEALIVMEMIKGDFEAKGLTRLLTKKVFPGLITDGEE